MTAYIIAIREKTRNAEELAIYNVEAPKARVDGLKALALYGAVETLEGPPTEGVVLLQFPDMATAKAWYESPGYQHARKHRWAGADYRFIMFEGL